MSAPLVLRPMRPSLTPASSSAFVCWTCQRTLSSFRRQRKALRVKPEPSFLPSKTEPRDHIIFNPPSSAPNVYHTPSKFLPKSDPRRKLHALASGAHPTTPSSAPVTEPFADSPSIPSSPSSLQRLPKPVRPPYEKKYHLDQEQIDEIRRLRAEDPRQWTRVRLAEKFECSPFFISLCCSSPEMKAEQDKELAAIKKRWGRKKTEAREERQARKALWGRDA